MNRFETEILTTQKNLKSLMDVPAKWIGRVRQRRPLDKLILDLDSSVSRIQGPRQRLRSPGRDQLFSIGKTPGLVAPARRIVLLRLWTTIRDPFRLPFPNTIAVDVRYLKQCTTGNLGKPGQNRSVSRPANSGLA